MKTRKEQLAPPETPQRIKVPTRMAAGVELDDYIWRCEMIGNWLVRQGLVSGRKCLKVDESLPAPLKILMITCIVTVTITH